MTEQQQTPDQTCDHSWRILETLIAGSKECRECGTVSVPGA